MKLSLSVAILVGIAFAASMLQSEAKLNPKKRPQDFPDACDGPKNAINGVYAGTPDRWTYTDDKNFYLTPGQSSCGANYTDNSWIVCVNKGWQGSAIQSRCNSWIKMRLPTTGKEAYAQVLDVCGDVPDSTFGCNDLYMTRTVFEALAGDLKDKAYADGHLPGQVVWRFVEEPCLACAGGYKNGPRPDGSKATCDGLDDAGLLRCGRRKGKNRVFGADVDQYCNTSITTCPNDQFPFAPKPSPTPTPTPAPKLRLKN